MRPALLPLLLLCSVCISAGETIWSEDFDDAATLTENWQLEGTGTATIVDGALHLQETPNGVGVVLWMREAAPADFRLSFELSFSNNQGIGVIFFAAGATDGSDAWAETDQRTGAYDEYIRGDLDSYSLSLHRYWPDGRNNPGSNLRRNSGFHLLDQALPDPCLEAGRPYQITIKKRGAHLRVWVDDELTHEATDDGSHGPVHGTGRIGLRIRGDASCVMRVDELRLSSL